MSNRDKEIVLTACLKEIIARVPLVEIEKGPEYLEDILRHCYAAFAAVRGELGPEVPSQPEPASGQQVETRPVYNERRTYRVASQVEKKTDHRSRVKLADIGWVSCLNAFGDGPKHSDDLRNLEFERGSKTGWLVSCVLVEDNDFTNIENPEVPA